MIKKDLQGAAFTMVTMSEITFIIIIQAVILLSILVAVLLYTARLKNKKLVTLKNEVHTRPDVSPTASAEYYLTAEIKLTLNRFDLLYTEKDLADLLLAEPDWLFLRKNLLEIEKDFLSTTNREEDFWLEVGRKYKAILKSANFVKRIKVKEVTPDEEGDEREDMNILLKSQHSVFEELQSDLMGEKSEEEINQLSEKLTAVARSHTELSHCIYVLEDENTFLRNQIQSLL